MKLKRKIGLAIWLVFTVAFASIPFKESGLHWLLLIPLIYAVFPMSAIFLGMILEWTED